MFNRVLVEILFGNFENVPKGRLQEKLQRRLKTQRASKVGNIRGHHERVLNDRNPKVFRHPL